MADPAPDEIAHEIAESFGAAIEIHEDELTGEVALSMETDSESMSATGFSRSDAFTKLIGAAKEVGWEPPVS